MIIGDVRGHLGLGRPVEPLAARCAAIEVDQGAGGIDGELIIAVGIGGQFDLDVVAISDRLVTILLGGDVQLLVRPFFATDGEVEVLPDPFDLDARAKGRQATGLEFPQTTG